MPAHIQFTDFSDVLAYLDTRGVFHIDLGLERMRNILDALDLRHPPLHIVQVLGTNGKGSTSSFLSALALAHDYSVGLFTSPHMVSPRERIRINGVMLSEERWVEYGNQILAAGGAVLTYFEFVTVLAVLAFSRCGVRLAIMEAGLGGAHDASTALPADMLLFSPIALDHQDYLGDTIEAIASDKGQAIRSTAPIISAQQDILALRCLEARAQQLGATLQTVTLEDVAFCRSTTLGLAGLHQVSNAALALAAWKMLAQQLEVPCNDSLCKRGLSMAFIPGRLQYIPPDISLQRPPLLLDGAHNSHGMAALGHALALLHIRPEITIFSCMQDKNPEQLIPHLRILSTGAIYTVPIANNSRCASANNLAKDIGFNAHALPSLASALRSAWEHYVQRFPEVLFTPPVHDAAPAAQQPDLARQCPVLICGSLYLLGEFFSLYPDALEPTLLVR